MEIIEKAVYSLVIDKKYRCFMKLGIIMDPISRIDIKKDKKITNPLSYLYLGYITLKIKKINEIQKINFTPILSRFS